MVEHADLFFGFVLGLFGSLVTWFLPLHIIVPDIRISSNLKRRVTRMGTVRNSFRIENIGRRAALEVSVYCRLFVVSTTGNLIFQIHTRRGYSDNLIPLLPTMALRGNRRIELYPEESTGLINHPWIVRHFGACQVEPNLIEDLLARFPLSYVRVTISAFDSLTQSRKVFMSKKLMQVNEEFEWPDRLPWYRRIGTPFEL